jgi:hypothetical protein
MDQVEGRTIHVRVVVIFDWTMTGMIVCAYLIRLLFK